MRTRIETFRREKAKEPFTGGGGGGGGNFVNKKKKKKKKIVIVKLYCFIFGKL